MSVPALTWTKSQRFSDPTLKAVVKTLAWAADKNGASWLSQASIAADCDLSVRAVRGALALLEQLGVVTRTARSRGKLGRTSDIIVLALHREFAIGKGEIVAARRALASGTICRKQHKLQPAADALASGSSCQGNDKDTTSLPSQGEKASGGGVGAYVREGVSAGGSAARAAHLRVVAGTGLGAQAGVSLVADERLVAVGEVGR